MRGASNGVATEPPSRVSKVRRFTAVDDSITFLQETEDTCGWQIPI